MNAREVEVKIKASDLTSLICATYRLESEIKVNTKLREEIEQLKQQIDKENESKI